MSSDHRLRVLIISDLFPNPVRYVSGIFVERQCHSLLDYCQQIVVAPVRVFPQLRIWKKVFQPKQLIQQVSEWQKELRAIPPFGEVNGLRVYYPRYTSLPKQGFHGTWGYFAYPFLLPLLRRLHQDQPFDLIHAHFASPAGLIARLCSRWMNVPVVLSVHGYDLAYTIKINALNRKIVINTFQEVDAILANSQKTLQGIAQYGIPKEKIHFVPLGADPEINVKVSNNHKEYIEILSVGNLYKQKGHEYVIRAVAALVKNGYRLKYKIVGDGAEEVPLRRLTRELGLEDVVIFEGYKPHSQVWSDFARCDLFVLPSWNEAFGLVYIEALWMGKPVIGCKGEGGPEDLSALGDCIALVKPRDVESLREALQHLLDDPERRQEMGNAGQRIVQEKYSWSQTAHQTLQIYQNLTHSK